MQNDFLYTKLQLIILLLARLYSSKRLLKGSEIAEFLGINERAVRRLIEELRQLGYEISAQPGIYGGYRLEQYNLFLPPIIAAEYQVAWQELFTYLSSSQDLSNYELIMQLLATVNWFNANPPADYYTTYQGFQLQPAVLNQLRANQALIKTALDQRHLIIFKYQANKKQPAREIELVPYGLIIYQQALYVKGHYPKDERLRTFRLSRMRDLRLSHKFYVPVAEFELPAAQPFSPEVLKPINIKLKLDYSQYDLKDYQLGANQHISEAADYFILEVTMLGQAAIIKFVLGLGAQVEVLEPDWLKEAIKKASYQVYLKY